jgi:DNA-directed RNA polymerase specialized sigma24 family protein
MRRREVNVSLLNEVSFPNDMTAEERLFLDFVKINMLKKLPDREKFLFLYIFEFGGKQADAAEILQVHETNISRRMKRIRRLLTPFRKGYVK